MTIYERDYIRQSILDLIPFEKPIIVTGNYQLTRDANSKYETFDNIKSWVWNAQGVMLTHHVNIPLSDVEMAYRKLHVDDAGKKFLLICKPYSYTMNGIKRGGLKLDFDFPEKPLFPISNWRKLMYIEPSLFLDMKVVINGEYAKNIVSLDNYVPRNLRAEKIKKNYIEKSIKRKKELEHTRKAYKQGKHQLIVEETPEERMERKIKLEIERWNKNQCQRLKLGSIINEEMLLTS